METETLYGVNPSKIINQRAADPLERFEYVSRCASCGGPVGNLKPISHLAAYAGFPSNSLRLTDKVLYHISPIMTKATIQCPQK